MYKEIIYMVLAEKLKLVSLKQIFSDETIHFQATAQLNQSNFNQMALRICQYHIYKILSQQKTPSKTYIFF